MNVHNLGSHVVTVNRIPDVLKALTGDPIDAAVYAGGLVVEREAKVSAPFLTGNLRRSIHTVSNAGESDGGDSGQLPTPPKGEAHVGTNVEYARRIELGFVGEDSLGRTYNQMGQPYLLPALENNTREIDQTVGEVIAEAIERAAR